jgi:AcrR family transcriptional regulator
VENTIGDTTVADRIAQKSLSKRGAAYASEVRRLLDAGLEVMRRCGTTSRPRVADIVAAAGLSNDAFYRHFASKDALVAAILEDGAERLASYLDHQMGKETAPDAKVRRWVEGVLTQAEDDVGATTIAVLSNAGGVGEGLASGRHPASAPVAQLLVEPLEALGSIDPALDASLAAHAVLGKLSDYLWQQAQPTRAEVDHITAFCLGASTVPLSSAWRRPEGGRASSGSPGGQRTRRGLR